MEQIAQWRIIREKYNPLQNNNYIVNIGTYQLTNIQKKILQTQPELKRIIDTFNRLKHCNCCQRHYYKKPYDINDNRTPNDYPEGDLRNYTGPVGGVEDEETIRFFTQYKDYKKHVIEKFRFSNFEDCDCKCRHKMRIIARSQI
jgi:hypothetical protein